MFILMPLLSAGQEKVYNLTFESRNGCIKLTNQAIKLIDEKKYAEAIPLLTKAISLDSVYRPTYLQLYKAYMLNKNYTGNTIDYMKKAKRVFSEDDEICYFTGDCYRVANDYANAIAEYNQAIALNSKAEENSFYFHLYYYNRGVCYMKTNKIDLAITDFSKALEIKPDHANSLLSRGVCYQMLKRKKEAIADWKKAQDLGNPIANNYIHKAGKK
jgi:tetratricopeptide (TPR) repeat protein